MSKLIVSPLPAITFPLADGFKNFGSGETTEAVSLDEDEELLCPEVAPEVFLLILPFFLDGVGLIEISILEFSLICFLFVLFTDASNDPGSETVTVFVYTLRDGDIRLTPKASNCFSLKATSPVFVL